MLSHLLLLALALQAPELQVPKTDPARDFDFWVGTWQVQNRHLQADGTWRGGTTTRARITPVLDGGAILEQWAGPFAGSFMNGFSLRSYDPATELWTILLFWTTDGNAGFGRMQGSFHHGRGTFLSPLEPVPGQGRVLRYTFSDALPQTVRWDQAHSTDGGQTWRTDWIMEFRRTAAASTCTEEQLFSVPWNPGSLSPHVEARALDWLRGSWAGTETRAGYKGVLESRLDCTLMDKDCLVVTQAASRLHGEEDWDKSLQVRGFVAQTGRWESWRTSEADPVLRQAFGQETEQGMDFVGTSVDGGELRESYERLGPDQMLWRTWTREPDGSWKEQVTRDLRRET